MMYLIRIVQINSKNMPHLVFIVFVEVLRPSQHKTDHIEHGQFSEPHFYWAGLVL